MFNVKYCELNEILQKFGNFVIFELQLKFQKTINHFCKKKGILISSSAELEIRIPFFLQKWLIVFWNFSCNSNITKFPNFCKISLSSQYFTLNININKFPF